MTLINPRNPGLPARLAEVSPTVGSLSAAGDIGLLSEGVRIGIVGSRHPRDDSAEHARRIAAEVASLGFVVVSGLAIGVDGIAHREALDAGGATIAVLASGLGHIHPVRNRELARQIAGSRSHRGVVPGAGTAPQGLVITEYGDGDEQAYPVRFRERNRIIAAVSDYLVVVQAMRTSGSMITARHALDLGVPIGVVPSAPTDPEYDGSIELVRDGADCVVDGRSLCWRLEIHGILPRGSAKVLAERLGQRQLELLGEHPLASMLAMPRVTEEIAELAGLDLRVVRVMLSELEEEGHILRREDGCWVTRSQSPT